MFGSKIVKSFFFHKSFGILLIISLIQLIGVGSSFDDLYVLLSKFKILL